MGLFSGLTDMLFGSDDPPPAPDPYATAAAQGTANKEAAILSAILSRYDQNTPWGNLTWEQGTGETFDQVGYDAAMAAYEKALRSRTPSGSIRGGGSPTFQPAVRQDEWGNWLDTSGNIIMQSGGGNTTQLVAPNRADFTTKNDPNKWTSNVTLSPEGQQLLDQEMATSLGLGSAITSGLERVQDEFSKPIDTSGLPNGVAWDPWNLAENPIELGAAPDLENSYQRFGLDDRLATASKAQGSFDKSLDAVNDTLANPFSFDELGARPEANDAMRKRIEDALYERMAGRLNPRFAEEQNAMEARLANQGITTGSQAWGSEWDTFGRGKNDAYTTAMQEAIMGGGTEMERLLGAELATRNQGINEITALRDRPFTEAERAGGLSGGAFNEVLASQGAGASDYGTQWAGRMNELNEHTALRDQTIEERGMLAGERAQLLGEEYTGRNQVLNELNALRTGAQVTPPTFSAQQTGANVGAAPVAQSVYNSYQGELGGYNAGVGSQNALLGGLSTLGAGYFMGGKK